MLYRKLGRTNMDVSVIGLGAEHLEKADYDTIKAVVDACLEAGINYCDLFMASPDVRDHFGKALEGKRDKMMFQAHIGATWQNGQYERSRDIKICADFVDDFMTRLRTDYIDVLMLHFIDEMDDLKTVFAPGGIYEYAAQLKAKGIVKAIGMSSHIADVSQAAVETGNIDVLMFPVNPAHDAVNGVTDIDNLFKPETYAALKDNASQGDGSDKRRLYSACKAHGTAITTMKTYAAGLLLAKDNYTGVTLTPAQAIQYALDRPGVASALIGCRDASQVAAALTYLDATEEERDYSFIANTAKWDYRGHCTYCNHCLPCPAGINIGETIRIYDGKVQVSNKSTEAEYAALPAKASECIQCAECEKRCPFDVPVIDIMEKTAKAFE